MSRSEGFSCLGCSSLRSLGVAGFRIQGQGGGFRVVQGVRVLGF